MLFGQPKSRSLWTPNPTFSSLVIAAAGAFALHNAGSSGTTNYEILKADWSGNVARLWTQNDGSGISRSLQVGASTTDGIASPQRYTTWSVASLPYISHAVGGASAGVNHELAIGNLSGSSGTQTAVAVSPTYTQTGTAAGIALLVNPSGTFGSGGGKLQSWQLASAEVAALYSTGTFDASNLRTNGTLGFQSAFAATADVILARDAADTLALRRSTNAQTFRVYNTYTDGSNYERGGLIWGSNVLSILTESAGTGVARVMNIGTAGSADMNFRTNSTNRWQVSSGGHFVSLSNANYLKHVTTTVGALPAAATAGAGARMFVSDANAPVFGAAVAGGGAVVVPVYSTGAAWNVG